MNYSSLLNQRKSQHQAHSWVGSGLVIFSWLSNQRYFKELTDQDVRARLYEEQAHAIEQDMAPFGFMDDGLEDDSFVDDKGEKWTPVTVRKGEIL